MDLGIKFVRRSDINIRTDLALPSKVGTTFALKGRTNFYLARSDFILPYEFELFLPFGLFLLFQPHRTFKSRLSSTNLVELKGKYLKKTNFNGLS